LIGRTKQSCKTPDWNLDYGTLDYGTHGDERQNSHVSAVPKVKMAMA